MFDRLSLAKQLAVEAGEITSRYFHGNFEIEIKPDQTLVTTADKEAEELITDRIRKHFPEDGYLGEEYGDCKGTSGFRWLIDPIDGTDNFARGIPIYSTLIGIEKNGEVEAGVVHSPEMREIYWAAKGKGAYLNDEKIHVSTVSELSGAHLIYPSFSKLTDEAFKNALFEIADQTFRSRGFGDYFGHVLIASGRAEIMMEPEVSPWDVAPIKILVEEAGGIFTDLKGEKTIYGQGAISASPHFHSLVIKALNPE